MKFALVDGQRMEARSGLTGTCPGCQRDVIAKCGNVMVHHWAHLGQRVCDPWWENESEWHRNWKSNFPLDWQEIVHKAEDGELHFADVKTAHGWVLEFQNSPIDATERISRNSFYPKLVWVVNGLRRGKDLAQFKKSLCEIGSPVREAFYRRICEIRSEKVAIVREWSGPVPVFFDFGEEHVLWCLLPMEPGRNQFVVECSLKNFIKIHNMNDEKDLFAKEMDVLLSL